MSFVKIYQPRSAMGWLGALLFVFCTISLFGGFADTQSASAAGTIPKAEPALSIVKSPEIQAVLSGETVAFEITVTNTGGVGINDIEVLDPLCDRLILDSDGNGGDDDLAIGEFWVYTCEIDNVTAKIFNTATVSGVPSTGGTIEEISNEAEANVFAAAPSIDVTKSTETPIILAGGSATFVVNVINDGNVPLSGVNVSDPMCILNLIDQGNDDPQDKLEQGEVWTYSCTVTGIDEQLINTVTATGLPLNGALPQISDTAEEQVDVISLGIQKGPAKQTVIEGEDATFDIVVTNDGSMPMAGVILDDPMCDILLPADSDLFSLAVNESRTFECTVENVVEEFTNFAEVIFREASGFLAKEGASADVNVTRPSIDIQKSPEKQVILGGSDVQFDIVVTNDGDVVLSDVVVDDPMCDSIFPSTPRTLQPGDSESYSCTVNSVDTHFVNVATATGTGSGGTTVSDEDDARVVVYVLKLQPSVEVSKSPDNQEVIIGNDATFNIDVTNDGNVALKDVVVDDIMCAPLTQTSNGNGDIFLEVGETWSYECLVPNVQADFTNTVNVQGFTLKDPQKLAPAIGSDSANVTVLRPQLSVSQTPEKQTIPAGGTATFEIEVINKGGLALEHVQLNVPKCKALVKPTATTLAPGASLSFTCVKPNIEFSFDNTAWATACVAGKKGVCVQSETNQVGVNIIEDQAPSITVSKEAGFEDDALIHPGGGNATFYVTVANDSGAFDPVTITSMTDDLYGDLLDASNPNVHNNTCEAVTIEPGSFYVCEFTALVIPPAVTDIVSVTAVDDEGQSASGTDEATVGLRGDVDCDKNVNAVDALKILRFDVGLIKIFKAKGCTHGVPSVNLYFCKFTDDQTACGAIQALHILRCDVGYSNLLCPENDPAGTTFDNEATAVSVGVDLATIPAGTKGSIMVPVHLSPNEGLVNSATVEVRYDSSMLRPKGCTADPDGRYDLSDCNANYADGIVRLAAISSDGVDSSTPLANLEFEVIGNLDVDLSLGMNVVDISGADGVALPVIEATSLNISQLAWDTFLPVILK